MFFLERYHCRTVDCFKEFDFFINDLFRRREKMTDNQILTRFDATSSKSKRRKHKVRILFSVIAPAF